MYLTKHQPPNGSIWACDGLYLKEDIDLRILLKHEKESMLKLIEEAQTDLTANTMILAPIEPTQEVWACGVTYLRSRVAREEESEAKDVYEKVYSAERPEIFFKALGKRVVGNNMPIRKRKDSDWDVPEPELTLVVNSHNEIIGYCAGNDVSSRAIEGVNPLYLPQAKMYEGACALGPGIQIADGNELTNLLIRMEISKNEKLVFEGQTNTSKMKRSFEELISYLTCEMNFGEGLFVMTGTGIVPDLPYTLEAGQSIRIQIGELTLENPVADN
jgi:2-dehydro-3-deoxy-D-arabinonate dehydratase